MEPCTSQKMLSDSQAKLLEAAADFEFPADDWWDDLLKDIDEKPMVEPRPKFFLPLGNLIWVKKVKLAVNGATPWTHLDLASYMRTD